MARQFPFSRGSHPQPPLYPSGSSGAGGYEGELVGTIVLDDTGVTPESIASYTLSCEDTSRFGILVTVELKAIGCVFDDDTDAITDGITAGQQTLAFAVKRPAAGVGQGRVVATLSASKRVGATVSVDIVPQSGLPRGIIAMWSGLLADLPDGWALCDGGTYDGVLTPDLRDRFVKGTAAGSDPGATGGATSASYTPAGTVSQPTFTGNAITDTTKAASGSTSVALLSSPKTPTGTVSQPTFSGTPATIQTQPPYFALAFIMKL